MSRAVTTILHLLRKEAQEQRFAHGRNIERSGGVFLTPSQMEAWADTIERHGQLTQPPSDASLNAPAPNNEDLL